MELNLSTFKEIKNQEQYYDSIKPLINHQHKFNFQYCSYPDKDLKKFTQLRHHQGKPFQFQDRKPKTFLELDQAYYNYCSNNNNCLQQNMIKYADRKYQDIKGLYQISYQGVINSKNPPIPNKEKTNDSYQVDNNKKIGIHNQSWAIEDTPERMLFNSRKYNQARYDKISSNMIYDQEIKYQNFV